MAFGSYSGRWLGIFSTAAGAVPAGIQPQHVLDREKARLLERIRKQRKILITDESRNSDKADLANELASFLIDSKGFRKNRVGSDYPIGSFGRRKGHPPYGRR